MCGEWGRFLFEARPDIFPEGRVTGVEMHLWSFYYEERNREMRKRNG